jgi:hypothetical protein
VIAQRERERRSSGFSPMAPLGGGAAEMVGRWCSIEAADGALMGRWFWARGEEIGARVGVMENVELSMPFIGPLDRGRRTVKGREAASMELQWHRLQEMKMGKGAMGCGHFQRGRRRGGYTVW